MLQKLRTAEELAVDLEHHSYRTFAGFLCLMQISTREQDFVVDTLQLRDELEELNETFTDPSIVKVRICSDYICMSECSLGHGYPTLSFPTPAPHALRLHRDAYPYESRPFCDEGNLAF